MALSEMLSAAVKVPATAGVKVTETAQVAPAASETPQALVSAKALGLAPESAMELIMRAPVPELLSVTDWAGVVAPCAPVKVSEVTLRFRAGEGVLLGEVDPPPPHPASSKSSGNGDSALRRMGRRWDICISLLNLFQLRTL